MKNLILCLIFCVSCSISTYRLREPLRTQVYGMMMFKMYPITVIQCMERKGGFQVDDKNKIMIETFGKAATLCVKEFNQTSESKDFNMMLTQQ